MGLLSEVDEGWLSGGGWRGEMGGKGGWGGGGSRVVSEPPTSPPPLHVVPVVFKTAMTVRITLRAPLSGTFLQRKDVVNQCLGVLGADPSCEDGGGHFTYCVLNLW